MNGETVTLYQPFLVISGLMLDGDTASNVTVSNGRVINTGDQSVVVGMAMPGLKASLGLDTMKNRDGEPIDIDIPESVVIEANVRDFELLTTVTVISNDALSSLDLDDVETIDELKDAMDELTDASTQLVDGTSDLYDGVEALSSGTTELTDGIAQLDDGASDLKSGAEELSGAGELKDGTSQLRDGGVELADGVAQLLDGAKALMDGMAEFDEEGIQSLSELMEDDAQELIDRLKAVKELSEEYTSFDSEESVLPGTVQFILRTESIRK